MRVLVATINRPFSARELDLRIMPGIQPKMQRQMLIRKSAPHPVFKNTETKGRKMARR
jgi:hypothetical protein